MNRYGTLLFLLLPALLAGCDEPRDTAFQGYVEGEYVYLASSRAGRLEKLMAERGGTVNAGAPLFALEAAYERGTLDQAEQEMLAAQAQLKDMESGKRPEEVAIAKAQLDQARADAASAAALLRRHQELIREGGISRQELDDSRAAAQSAAARVTELARQVEVYNLPERKEKIEAQQAMAQAAEARVVQARWELEQKQVYAPTAGLVCDTLFRQGEWVAAGSPVVQMLPPGNVKIRFFVPEPLISRIRPGGRVLVRVDGRVEPLPATISYIAADAEYTPPIIYSQETRSKLVFMAEARPEPEEAPSLHPGQPLSVSLP